MYDVVFVNKAQQKPMARRKLQCIPHLGDTILLDGKEFGKPFAAFKVDTIIHNVLKEHQIYILVTHGNVQVDFLGVKKG